MLRPSVSGKRGRRLLGRALCAQPTLSRLLAALAQPENREGLRTVLLELVRRTGRLDEGQRRSELVLDLDSLPLEVFGYQPGSTWNGHYRCYHPVVVRWDRSPFLAAELREGQAHTAEGALGFVAPVLLRAKAYAERVWLHMNAGFPEPELLATLEDEGVAYVARLRGNAVLERLAAPRLRQPPAESRLWLHELAYRAAS